MLIGDDHHLHLQIADVVPVREGPGRRDLADAVVLDRLQRVDEFLSREIGPSQLQPFGNHVGVAIGHQVEDVRPSLGRAGIALVPGLPGT